MGPFCHPSMSWAKYVLTFIDDWSRYTWVYFLKKKSKVFEYLKEFKEIVEKKLGKGIKIPHIDNGGDYVKRDFYHLCT
jgi:transposase InsO family protein